MAKLPKTIVFLVGCIAAFFSVITAQSPSEQLKDFSAQLQKTPTDNALRAKIIKLAITAKPPLPEEAERRMARGLAAFKGAKSVAEYQDAIKEFEAAVAVAPWYADAYFNLGVTLDKAERYADALQNLKWAQMASPDAKDIKTLIYEVEYRAEKVIRAKAEDEAAANSPQGKAKAMLAILGSKYAGPVNRLLICGVNLNQYWHCTDKEASGSNWVNSANMNAFPPPGPGSARYRIVGADADMIEIKLGDYGAAGDSFRTGCAKPNGTDLNSMSWVNCPGWEKAGEPTAIFEIRFWTDSSGSSVIEYRDGLPCDSKGCRRAQFILEPK